MKFLAPISLVLLTLVVLGRVCAFDFTEWDDPSTIARNPALNPPTLKSVAGYWIKPELALYIPLTYTTWGALAAIARVDHADESSAQLNPWVFHSANLAIHLASVLLVWKILRALSVIDLAAWFATAIFAIHPVQVETVAWASGTKDVLCGMLVLATILLFIRFRRTRRRGDFIFATLAMIAACLSKPTAVVAPIIAVIFDTILLRTPMRKSLATLSIWFAIALLFAIIAKIVQPPVMVPIESIWVRPLIAGDAIAFYLWKLFWPANLGIDYGRSPANVVARGWIALTWLAPAIIAITANFWRREQRAAALIFLAGLLPVLGLIPFTFQSISTVADHYLYLPMLGVAIFVALAIRSRSAIVIAALVTVFFSVQSLLIAGNWRNSDTLFAQALRVNPKSAVAQTNWAVAIERSGDTSSAIAHLRAAIDANPDYGFAHFNLAGLLLKQDRRAEALVEYREFLRVYRMQKNFDPQLDASTQRVIESLTSSQPGEAR